MRAFSSATIRQQRQVSIIVCLSLCFFLTLSVSLSFAASAGKAATCISPEQTTPGTESADSLPEVSGIILINEILTAPRSQWNCSSDLPGRNIWVELYNPQNQPFNLYTARTSIDTGPGSQPFLMPLGTAIAAHDFLVIFPFLDLQHPMTTFRLGVENGAIPIDSVDVPTLAPDTSYARQPDGGPTWAVNTQPTIDASNVPPLPTPTPTEKTKLTPTPNSTRTSKPTPTPKPVKTPTPRAQGANQTKSPPNSSGAQSNSEDPTPAPQVDGTQPAWNGLALASLPDTGPGTPGATDQAQTGQGPAPPTQPTGTANDPGPKILLTLLAVALMAALLWSYRLFTTAGRNAEVKSSD